MSLSVGMLPGTLPRFAVLWYPLAVTWWQRSGAGAGTTLAVLTGLNVLNYLDRYVLGGVLPLVIDGLHLSGGAAGSLQSVFILVYSLTSPAFGWLGDRGDRRLRLAAFGVVVWSLATFGSGLAATFGALLLARALVGVGEASYAIVTPSLISDLYPASHRGRALAFFYAAMPVGSALGYMLGGTVGTHFGWRTAFFVAGGPGLLFALALLLLREPARGRYDVARPGTVGLSLSASWRGLRARPSYLVNTAAQTVYTFSMGGLALWMPTYFFRERGLPLAQASLLFGGVLLLAGFVGTLLGGFVGDRLLRRHRAAHFLFSGWTLVLSLPFTLLAVLAADPAIFWSGMFITLLLLFLNVGPLNAAMTNVLPPELRARGFAVYTVIMHLLGDALSPTLIGLASDAVGLRMPVLVTGLLLVVAGLILLAGRQTLTRDLQTAEAA
jgi:MFS transporter, Spinster family, sphingosine-1-phosphate transporter